MIFKHIMNMPKPFSLVQHQIGAGSPAAASSYCYIIKLWKISNLLKKEIEIKDLPILDTILHIILLFQHSEMSDNCHSKRHEIYHNPTTKQDHITLTLKENSIKF